MNINQKSLSDQLSTGTQSFERLITEGRIYVDKTQHIHRLLKGTGQYFLSRPRRFGKSLLVSTLQALFEGKRELFKDTYINSADYDWQKYPVINLDMSRLVSRSLDALCKSLVLKLHSIAQNLNVSIDPQATEPEDVLDLLIQNLAQKHQQKVVVLIDEYDAPILNTIPHLDEAKHIRDILKGFYTVLKSQNHNIKFLFMAGITKFSHVSIFSGLNNLVDLSEETGYEDLLGYTQNELEQFFPKHIDRLAETLNLSAAEVLDQIKEWYNGYRFSEEEIYVYNPHSTLNLFRAQKFKNWWFKSGTPSFLVHMLQNSQDWQAQDFEEIEVGSSVFDTFDLENLDLTSVLLQTGYLTIKDYASEFGGVYTVGHPNKEVHESFMRSLLEGMSGVPTNKSDAFIFQMSRSLMAGEVQGCIEGIKTLFKKIPYTAHLKHERDYRNIIYAVQVLLGSDAQMEVHTNKGRIDTAVETPQHIYIFEYKVNQTAQKALDQIKNKRYYEPYEDRGKKIWLVGINFSEAERNIDDEAVEEWVPQKSP